MQGVEAQAVMEEGAQEALDAKLHQLVLPLTDQIDAQALAKMRRRFFSRVQDLKTNISTDRTQQPEVMFTPKEVVQITNYFFSDMLGVKALKRLSKLAQYYSGQEDTSLSLRARLLAEDSNTPHMLRAYYNQLHKATEHIGENQVFRYVQLNLRLLDFLKEHKHLKLLAQQKDPHLTAVLKDLGYTTRRGVTTLTCLLKALSTSLVLSKTDLSEFIHDYAGLEKLVELFGKGVILLLPTGIGPQ